MTFRFLLPLLLIPISAFATDQHHPYSCDNGQRFDIAFSAAADGRPQATLNLADGPLVLPQVPVASGALYRDDKRILHTKDNGATFEDGKGNTWRCQRGDVAPQSLPPTPVALSSFIDITGQVSYRTRHALPADAILHIRVQDGTGRKARILAEQSYELAGTQVPIPFSTTIDRDLIGKQARVTVAASIDYGGKRRLVSTKAYPALKHGEPVAVDILLKPVSGKRR